MTDDEDPDTPDRDEDLQDVADEGEGEGVPDTDPRHIDPAGHMADLVESGAVDMELDADADRDELREFLDAAERGEFGRADPGLVATVRIVRSLLDEDVDGETDE